MLLNLITIFTRSFCWSVLTNALVCTNGTVRINGAIDVTSKALYNLVSPRYTKFRKSAGIDVTITRIDSAGKFITRGLGGPVFSPPVVFVTTPFTVPENYNSVEFPLFARAIILIYNLPGVTNLNISLRVISAIYRGSVIYWNDAKITKYNPNAEFPNTLITPVARMDTDSSTTLLTKIFKANDPYWNDSIGVFSSPNFEHDKCCNSTSWPLKEKMFFGKDTVGVVGIVNSFENTIGYVTKDAISMYDLNYVSLVKHTDRGDAVVVPSTENVEQAMRSFLKDGGPTAFQLVSDTVYNDTYAYELSAFSSIVLNYSYTDNSIDCCAIQELVGFIDWFYGDSNDAYMGSLGYIQLISELTDRIKMFVLNRVKCKGEFMYSLYLSSLVQVPQQSAISIGEILLYVAVVMLVGVVVLFIFLYCVYYKRQKNDIKWLIDSRRIKISEGNVKFMEHNNKHTSDSLISPDKETGETISVNTFVSKSGKMLRYITENGEMDDTKVSLCQLLCKPPQLWSFESKKLANKFKNVISRNVATLLGVTTIGLTPYSVYEFCAKGTLHYVLSSTRYELTDPMKSYFMLDVASGLRYLHRLGIVHGMLSSLSCYVDSSWTVKIIFWDQLSIYQRENEAQLNEDLTYSTIKLVDKANFIRMIYMDPEASTNKNPSADIFSFGFILLEVFLGKLPYARDVEDYHESYPDILHKKFSRKYIVQPVFHGLPTDIINLFNTCVASKEKRPNIIQVHEELKKHSSSAPVGIVDLVLETLEKHAEALEEKVEERTAALKKVTDEMSNLLNEVLPPQIAEQLLAGRSVMPEHYECATIYFSDIVGFTSISAMSSPIEVMKLLNDLWTAFDRIIDKYDVYKIDTIGDAYMVCSGLPQRNGMNHCKEIALMALALREKCKRFKVRHLPNYSLNIRIGVNSGPVTAGVVGSKLPQYCVFGDAVNTAARMESTSIPQKIQLTERSYNLLNDHFPTMFSMEYRGETDIKGKGAMKTYWLERDKATCSI